MDVLESVALNAGVDARELGLEPYLTGILADLLLSSLLFFDFRK